MPIPYFVPKSLESSFIPTQANPCAIPFGRISNTKKHPRVQLRIKQVLFFAATLYLCVSSHNISPKSFSLFIPFQSHLFDFIFTFSKSPIPDFNFFAVHTLGKLTGFNKLIRHGNKKLLAVFFHQIKLFIRVFYRVD